MITKVVSLCSYDPEQDRWFVIAPMRSKRLAVGVAVVNRLVSFYGYNYKNFY